MTIIFTDNNFHTNENNEVILSSIFMDDIPFSLSYSFSSKQVTFRPNRDNDFDTKVKNAYLDFIKSEKMEQKLTFFLEEITKLKKINHPSDILSLLETKKENKAKPKLFFFKTNKTDLETKLTFTFYKDSGNVYAFIKNEKHANVYFTFYLHEIFTDKEKKELTSYVIYNSEERIRLLSELAI